MTPAMEPEQSFATQKRYLTNPRQLAGGAVRRDAKRREKALTRRAAFFRMLYGCQVSLTLVWPAVGTVALRLLPPSQVVVPPWRTMYLYWMAAPLLALKKTGPLQRLLLT